MVGEPISWVKMTDESPTPEQNRSRISRRSAIRAAGVGGALLTPLGTAGTALAKNEKNEKEQYLETLEQANKIRDRAGREAMEKFLKSKNVGVASRTGSLKTERGISTQNEFSCVKGDEQCDRDDGDINLNFTLFTNSSSTIYTIDMEWTYDDEPFENGEPPVDYTGLYFESSHWNIYGDTASTSTYSSGSEVSVNTSSQSLNGIGFEVDDNGAKQDGSTSYYCGLNIEPVGDYSYQERQVRGEYTHTWGETTYIDSFSIGLPHGASVSFKKNTNVNEIATTTEGDGDTWMTLTQAEATLD